MNELTPAAVIVEAHRILKSLVSGNPETVSHSSPAALNWLVERQMIAPQNAQYDVTNWGRVALLGRHVA